MALDIDQRKKLARAYWSLKQRRAKDTIAKLAKEKEVSVTTLLKCANEFRPREESSED